MVAAPTTCSVGVIAEDDTDVEVIRVLTRRILGPRVSVKRRSGKGCAKIPKKAAVWFKQFADEGCAHVVLLRDLDRNPENNALNDEPVVRRELEGIETPAGLRRLVCIPVEELEAWFWADQTTVQHVGRGSGKAVASPHLVSKPKEALIRLSLGANGRPRYSTNDNAKLAEILDLDVCSAKCPSFKMLREFLAGAG